MAFPAGGFFTIGFILLALNSRLFRELGQPLPLITTNCAILYLAIFQTNRGYDFMEGTSFALGAGAGSRWR